jgi:hypothetical protein
MTILVKILGVASYGVLAYVGYLCLDYFISKRADKSKKVVK